MKRTPRRLSCPNADEHTPAPPGYIGWHLWAEEMGRTHTQTRCPTCQLYAIWTPTPGAPDLPPVDYRLDHKSCMCCGGNPTCTCRYHRPSPLRAKQQPAT